MSAAQPGWALSRCCVFAVALTMDSWQIGQLIVSGGRNELAVSIETGMMFSMTRGYS